MPRLFGTFGVRGVANVELTPKLAFDLGLALATHLEGAGKVVIGQDNRTSSEMLEHAIIAGITGGGCDVLRIGIVPTPVLSFAVRHFGCAAGVMITASHNPPQYNGIKFWSSDGSGFVRARESEIERIFERGAWKRAGWREVGRVERADAISPYIQALLRRARKLERELKVVVDCANATGSLVTPYVLKALGCRVISMNCQLDGIFPGRPFEPVPENLGELARAVVASKADLGVAQDGDADRTAAVDERGEVLMGDRVFALAGRHHLKGRKRPRIITPVATSSAIDDVAAELGGEVVRTRVGEPEIIEGFKRHGGDLGGEENAGVVFFDWLLCREGPMTVVKFLEALDGSGLRTSGLNATLPRYFQVKLRLGCPDALKPKVLEMLERKFSGCELDRTDGLRVQTEEGWLLLRPSGTEPIFRCFAEARRKERAEELAGMGMRELEACVRKAR